MNKTGFISSAFILSLLFFSSCKDPGYIEFLKDAPEEDFDVNAIDTFTVVSSTVKEDTLAAQDFTADLFGVLNDSIFGLTHYSMFFQVELPKVDYDFGPNPVAVSAELRLKRDDGRTFGNTGFTQTMKVYKLNERIIAGRGYATGTRFSHLPDAAGQVTTAFNTNDSIVEIPLDQMFAQSLIPTDPVQYSTGESFKDFMNGLAVVPDTTGIPSGEGAIVPFLLTSGSSVLVLNYTNDTGNATVTFPINASSARIEGISQNYSGSPVATQLVAPQQQFQRVFAQPHGRVKIWLQFPTLRDLFVDNSDVALMQAKVIIPAITDQADTLSPPSRLLLYGINENGKSFVLPDAQFTFYGGVYNADDKNYQFIVTQYFQDELLKLKANPDYDFNGAYIIVKSDNPLEANRLVARAKQISGKEGIRLKLTLTKLK